MEYFTPSYLLTDESRFGKQPSNSTHDLFFFLTLGWWTCLTYPERIKHVLGLDDKIGFVSTIIYFFIKYLYDWLSIWRNKNDTTCYKSIYIPKYLLSAFEKMISMIFVYINVYFTDNTTMTIMYHNYSLNNNSMD